MPHPQPNPDSPLSPAPTPSKPTPREYCFLPRSHLDFESALILHEMANSAAVFMARLLCLNAKTWPRNTMLSLDTYYKLVQCLRHKINCVQWKWSLHSRWFYHSTAVATWGWIAFGFTFSTTYSVWYMLGLCRNVDSDWGVWKITGNVRVIDFRSQQATIWIDECRHQHVI